MSNTTLAPALSLTVQDVAGRGVPIEVLVRRAYNFGYAARDTRGVSEHLKEMGALGLPVPTQIPAIFPIPPGRISTGAEVVVTGDQTYGEVEFALIKTEEHGWIVTIASDHTDLEIERTNMPKAKAMCPDVIGTTAWRLDAVDDWDSLVLRLWGHPDAADPVLIQEGPVGKLLRPADLIRILEERQGAELSAGTVILSGTIGGEPTPGMRGWRAELENPRNGQRLALEYSLDRLPEEI